MQFKKSCDIVDIKSKRHDLPIDVILFHMVDYAKIKSLPQNQDCTQLLHQACHRALDQMFAGRRYYVETFMPRHKEFEALLIEELEAFRQGEWNLGKGGKIPLLNDNEFSFISF